MKKTKSIVLTICCFIFLLLGLFTAAIGPVLPELAENNGSTLSNIGMIFSGMFIGALVSQLIAGPLGDRIGQQKVIYGSLLLMTVGMLGVSLSRSLALTLALAFLSGLGHGGLDLGCNVLIAMVYKEKSVSALNLLNLFFGLGAFSGPTLVSLTIKQLKSGMPVFWLGCGLMLLSMFFFFGVKINDTPDLSEPKNQIKNIAQLQVYRSPLVWLLGLLIMIYVGTENGVGGWATTYMQRTASLSIENAALVTAGFWLALTAGRMTFAALGLRLLPYNILFASLTGAIAGGMILVMTAGSLFFSTAAIILIGFSFGSIYPTVMAIIVGYFREEPGKAVGTVAAMGSIGGAVIPWLQGITLEQLNISSVAWFALGGAAVMMCMLLLSRLQINARTQAVNTESIAP